MIEPGAAAPDFTLPTRTGSMVSLEDLRGQTTVLVFYPLDFSPVCTDQLNVYQEVLGELEEPRRAAARHLGRRAFATRRSGAARHHDPAAGDFHPKGEVAQAYGVCIEERGTTSARS